MSDKPQEKDNRQLQVPVKQSETQPFPSTKEVYEDLTDLLDGKMPEIERHTQASDDEKEDFSDDYNDDDDFGETDLESEFNDAADELKEEISETLEDRKRLAEVLLKGYDMLRCILWPMAYRRVLFSPTEMELHVPELRSKISTPVPSGEKLELDAGEQELLARLIDYRSMVQDVPLKEEEIKWLSYYLAPKLNELPAAEWLSKNSWVIALAVIEGKRGLPLFSSGMDKMVDHIMQRQSNTL